jgi:hypothetical protein
MPTNNDANDLLDTLLDRLAKATPEELAEFQRRAQAVRFDPNEPVDKEALNKRVAAWRQREADKLFNGD